MLSATYNLKEFDYVNTFSHVTKLTIMRILLILIVAKRMPKLNVTNVFLHEEAYMTVLSGLTYSYPNEMCKLIGSYAKLINSRL